MSRAARAGATGHLLRRRPLRAWPAALIAIAHLSGCALHGPDAMRASRLAYNDAVQVSDQRELLLNLVRLRYTEAPEFLAINSISTQMSFAAGASVGGEFGEVEDNNSAFVSPGVSVGYSETPTITFTPQRDEAFTGQLVAPIELDSIYLLTQYGWGIDRVLQLIARSVNEVDNTISRETDQATATLHDFATLATQIRRLETERLIRVDVEQRREVVSDPVAVDKVSAEDLLRAADAGYRLEYQDNPPRYALTEERAHYVLTVKREAWEHPDFQSLSKRLSLPPGKLTYEIDPFGNSEESGLRISTRSVLGTLAYLSNAVAVPEPHSNVVNVADDIRRVLNDVLDIRVSATPVETAYVSVPHRGYWFYVDDRDHNSKRTLGLLTSLIRLSISAGGAENVPVLTLPVSR